MGSDMARQTYLSRKCCRRLKNPGLSQLMRTLGVSAEKMGILGVHRPQQAEKCTSGAQKWDRLRQKRCERPPGFVTLRVILSERSSLVRR